MSEDKGVKTTQVWLGEASKEPIIIYDLGGIRIVAGCPSGFVEEILGMDPDPPVEGESLYIESRRIGAPEGERWEGTWSWKVKRVRIYHEGIHPREALEKLGLSSVEITALEEQAKPNPDELDAYLALGLGIELGC